MTQISAALYWSTAAKLFWINAESTNTKAFSTNGSADTIANAQMQSNGHRN
jgi:hypothetical protein